MTAAVLAWPRQPSQPCPPPSFLFEPVPVHGGPFSVGLTSVSSGGLCNGEAADSWLAGVPVDGEFAVDERADLGKRVRHVGRELCCSDGVKDRKAGDGRRGSTSRVNRVGRLSLFGRIISKWAVAVLVFRPLFTRGQFISNSSPQPNLEKKKSCSVGVG